MQLIEIGRDQGRAWRVKMQITITGKCFGEAALKIAPINLYYAELLQMIIGELRVKQQEIAMAKPRH